MPYFTSSKIFLIPSFDLEEKEQAKINRFLAFLEDSGVGAIIEKEIRNNSAAVNSADPEALWALQRIDSFCSLFRRVISLHMGEKRENLQHYLDWACLRRYVNTLKPKESKTFMLCFCASTEIDYKRPRKKPGKAG